MLVFFNPIKFGITFTVGNLLSLGRLVILQNILVFLILKHTEMVPNRTNKRLPKFFKVFIPRLSSASLKIPDAWVQHLNALPKNVVLQNQIRKIWHMLTIGYILQMVGNSL